MNCIHFPDPCIYITQSDIRLHIDTCWDTVSYDKHQWTLDHELARPIDDFK